MDEVNNTNLQLNIDNLKEMAYETSSKYLEKLSEIESLFKNSTSSNIKTILNNNQGLLNEFEDLSKQMDNLSRITSAVYSYLVQPIESNEVDVSSAPQPADKTIEPSLTDVIGMEWSDV